MIRFAIIGSNFITDKFLDAAASCEEFKLTCVYSRSLQRAAEYAKVHNAPYTYDNLEELAKSIEFDAVYIASPNSVHFAQTMMMLNHGKHVLCEKPIASNSKELKLMFEAAKANDVILLEAMRPVFDPAYFIIENNLSKLGIIRRATFQYCQYSSRYDKFKEGIIENAFNPKYSNGSLMDIGVYCVHPLVKLFGMPEEIKGSGIMLHNGVDGAGTIVATYKDMQAELLYSKITNSKLPSQIQGEKGSMMIDQISEPKNIQIIYNNGEIENLDIIKNSNNMIYELQAFIDFIKDPNSVHKHNVASTMELQVMDEARKQIGIVFPADKINEM